MSDRLLVINFGTVVRARTNRIFSSITWQSIIAIDRFAFVFLSSFGILVAPKHRLRTSLGLSMNVNQLIIRDD